MDSKDTSNSVRSGILLSEKKLKSLEATKYLPFPPSRLVNGYNIPSELITEVSSDCVFVILSSVFPVRNL